MSMTGAMPPCHLYVTKFGQPICRTDCNTSLVTNKLLVLCVTLGCHVSRHGNTLIVTIITHYLYYLEKYPGIRLWIWIFKLVLILSLVAKPPCCLQGLGWNRAIGRSQPSIKYNKYKYYWFDVRAEFAFCPFSVRWQVKFPQYLARKRSKFWAKRWG